MSELGCGGEPKSATDGAAAVEPSPEPAPAPVAEPEPPKPTPFEWHVAMTLPAKREFHTLRGGGLPLVVDDDAYWIGGGEKKMIKLPRSGSDPAEIIALGDWMNLFAAHGDELLLYGDDAIYVLPKAGGKPEQRLSAPEHTFSPALVGERVVLRSNADDGGTVLHHAPVTGGEFTSLPMGAKVVERQPAVRGAAMLLILDWGKIVSLGGDLSKVETVYELGADAANQYIREVAWVGDAIVFVIGEISDDPKLRLIRRTPDGAQTPLQEAPGDRQSLLISDGERALWQVEDQGAWVIDAQTIQPVELGGWTTHASATAAGLAWQAGSEIRIATAAAGDQAAAPELPAEAFAEELELRLLSRKSKTPQRSVTAKAVGALEADTVRRIARVHLFDLRKCEGRRPDPKLSGSLDIGFTVGSDGKLSEVAAINGDAFPNQDVVACMVADIESWSMIKPGRGGIAKVVLTFVFG